MDFNVRINTTHVNETWSEAVITEKLQNITAIAANDNVRVNYNLEVKSFSWLSKVIYQIAKKIFTSSFFSKFAERFYSVNKNESNAILEKIRTDIKSIPGKNAQIRMINIYNAAIAKYNLHTSENIEEAKLAERKNPTKEAVIAGQFDGMGIIDEPYEHNEKRYDGLMYETIAFVGKSKTGKSSTISMLKNIKFVHEKPSQFVGTVDAAVKTIKQGVKTNNKAYFKVTNCIDTPGLFEQEKMGNNARDNEELLKNCIFGNDLIKNQLPDISRFYLTYITRTDDDIESMNVLIDELDNKKIEKSRIVLLQTRCENSDSGQREIFKDELLQDGRMQGIFAKLKDEPVEKSNMPVLFSANLSRDTLENNLHEQRELEMKNVKELRVELKRDSSTPLLDLAKEQGIL